MRRLLLALALASAPHIAGAQGLPLGRVACEGTYMNIPMQGVVDFTSYQYGQFSGLGGTGSRSQIGYFMREGRMHDLPGTVMMLGAFQSQHGFAHFEAQVVAGLGRGAVWVNGASHRQTFAQFGFFPGGMVMMTEDGVRVDFACHG